MPMISCIETRLLKDDIEENFDEKISKFKDIINILNNNPLYGLNLIKKIFFFIWIGYSIGSLISLYFYGCCGFLIGSALFSSIMIFVFHLEAFIKYNGCNSNNFLNLVLILDILGIFIVLLIEFFNPSLLKYLIGIFVYSALFNFIIDLIIPRLI